MSNTLYISEGAETKIGKVGRPCDGDHLGHWYCSDCDKHFAQNWEAGGHIRHGLIWVCDEHGPTEGSDGP